MIGYVTLGTNDLPRAIAFYDKLLGALGAKRVFENERGVAWGTSATSPGLGVMKPFDGQPATRAAASLRLARMLLADPEGFSEADARAAADWCARAQARQVARALARVARAVGWKPDCVVLSGHGACLAKRALDHLGWMVDTVPLADRIGHGMSRAACAHALALIERRLVP